MAHGPPPSSKPAKAGPVFLTLHRPDTPSRLPSGDQDHAGLTQITQDTLPSQAADPKLWFSLPCDPTYPQVPGIRKWPICWWWGEDIILPTTLGGQLRMK